MWTKINIAGGSYVIKRTVNQENCHRIQLTDFITLWYEDIHQNKILQRCKELNRLLEASDEHLLANVFSLIESEETDISRTFSCDDEATPNEGKTLCVQSAANGFKFRIKFLMKPANSTQFYEDVTRPFLITISELERRQQKLEDELRRKDVEIMEYKLEGAQITRKTVETEPFDSEAFQERCNNEDLSKTKSTITSQPCRVFSSGVQRLMGRISDAPIVDEDGSENTKPNQKKTLIKLKSPLKTKKLKLYEDDDDVEEDKNCASVKEEKISEAKGENQKANVSRRKTKPKLFNL